MWKDEDGNVVDLQDMPNVQFIAPHVARGFLGVELTDLTPELRRHFGAHEDRGVLVGRVVEDSPAERAGLRVGDVITHIDGEPVTSSFDVTARIGGRAAGDVAALEVVRDGKVETLSATLEVRERPQVEIGDLLRRFGEEGDGGFAYQFDTGELEKQLESVREHFSSPEWKQQMEQIEKDLQTQMQHIEVEIQGLQDKLDVDASRRRHGRRCRGRERRRQLGAPTTAPARSIAPGALPGTGRFACGAAAVPRATPCVPPPVRLSSGQHDH